MQLVLPNKDDGPIAFDAKVQNSIAHADYVMARMNLYNHNQGEQFEFPWDVSREDVDAAIRAHLSEEVAAITDQHPDVPYESVLIHGARNTEKAFNISRGGLNPLLTSITNPLHWSVR